MRRWIFLIALLPNCTGCLYYAYPTLVHTPEVTVPNRDGSVHAFRVDVDRTDRPPERPVTRYSLARIPVNERGVIPSQVELAHATGLYKPLAENDNVRNEHSHFTILVRLYRPGSRTMTVRAWDRARDLQWDPAPDLIAQEKAIDDLLGVPAIGDEATPGAWWEVKDAKLPERSEFNVLTHTMTATITSALGLQSGQESTAQRQALLFAASEYDRLASSKRASFTGMEAVRERLQQKAIWLRRHAEQTER